MNAILNDIKKIYSDDDQWYRKIWTLAAQEMSWVEQTQEQVDFIWDVLEIDTGAHILDLACGFGRHALELARRGCRVVGVDITSAYIEEAKNQASNQGLNASFICADLRDLQFSSEFDVVLNLADGAIGYLENDTENLKIFDRIAAALKPGGKHLMDVCNGAYAAKHFPKRNWVFGKQSLSLADFEWDQERSRMFSGGLEFRFGEKLEKPDKIYSNPTRLYNLEELTIIFQDRAMEICQAYGGFNPAIPATDDIFQIQVISQKQ